MKIENFISEFIIIRSPLLAFNNISNFYDNIKINPSEINTLKDIYFNTLINKEALYIASKDFFDFVENQKSFDFFNNEKDKRTLSTLLKYYSRITTRATPFGLFASLSYVDLVKDKSQNNEDFKVILKDELEISRKVSFDSCYQWFHKLYNIDDIPKEEKNFIANPTLYKKNGIWSYNYLSWNGVKMEHQHKKVSSNLTLDNIISASRKNTLSIDSITKQVINFGFESHEAVFFVKNLITQQILLDFKSPNITGQYSYNSMFTHSQHHVDNINSQIHSPNLAIETWKYKKILSDTSKLITSSNKNVIEVNCFNEVDSYNVPISFIKDAFVASKILIGIKQASTAKFMNKIKKEFYDKFENREIKLTDIFDPMVGITINEFTSKEEGKIAFKKLLINRAYQNNSISADISEKELHPFINSVQLPPSFSFLGSIVKNHEGFNQRLTITTATGPSSACFISRFTDNDKIRLAVDKIVNIEEKHYGSKILAEIAFCSEDNINFILKKPFNRKYEIPINTVSILEAKNQILLDDIYIKIERDKFILRSQKLNKEIVPINTSLHNYNNDKNTLYRFLCHLQYQYSDGSEWTWDEYDDLFFLPRVTYKNIILSFATWNFNTKILKDFDKLENDACFDAFTKFRKNHKIPDCIIWVEYDNYVYLNLSNIICIRLLLGASNGTSTKIQEFIWNDESLSVQKNGLGKICEIIIPFNNIEKEDKEESFLIRKTQKLLQKSYLPFSNWIYFKIYGNKQILDFLLFNGITDILNRFMGRKKIQTWFFVRYFDDYEHLRLRINVKDEKDRILIVKSLNLLLTPYQENNSIWRIQLDTYIPEYERYGNHTICFCEDIFGSDTQYVIKMNKGIFKFAINSEYKIIAGLLGIKAFLNSFQLNHNEIEVFINLRKNDYQSEFSSKYNLKFKKDISALFNKNKTTLLEMLGSNVSIGKIDNQVILSLYKQAIDFENSIIKNSQKIIKINKDRKQVGQNDDILSSLIHMFFNRLFVDEQRLFEFMCYEVYYLSLKELKRKLKI